MHFEIDITKVVSTINLTENEIKLPINVVFTNFYQSTLTPQAWLTDYLLNMDHLMWKNKGCL